MGTPDFAVPALEALIELDVDVVCVVTQPDRPRGRGHKLSPSPVKEVALRHNIPVLQPENIKNDEDFYLQLSEAAPSLIVVAAYGKILPKRILDIPPCGCVNIHASLLPKFRGAAPIHRAIEAGEEESGISLMYMSEGLDEGDVIATCSVDIRWKNVGELHDILAEKGAKLLVENLTAILEGKANRTEQDPSKATYAAMLSKEDGQIDFSASSKTVIQKVLAMTPFPGAYAFLDDVKVKIICVYGFGAKAKYFNESCPGTIIIVNEERFIVATGDGYVEIEKLQMPGGKPMKAYDYLRGHSVPDAASFLGRG